ncbi:Rpn family recombination-promoting nuclease/putative transposase [Salmonella enterica subsp. enterica]|nr:hypothetical protein [Salmonella enterica subsp. enterica]EIK6739662.1 Rpn family recombination-promoting nuclease/putative transposase [Salmonella enterica subsp. enterica serovar Aqua]HCM8927840.1 Rpn family recombination-promoting nuclease/putative transposase [Salmonella enterica subsp. enterica serovar Paratyphi B]
MNNSGTPHPHDSFFKIVMSQPEAARDFLNIHLPPALLAAINYAVRDGDTDDYHRFINTLAQRLREEGLEKGIIIGEQRGIEKGRLEGKLEGKLEVARQMLANGMDRSVVMQIAGLSEDDMKNIRH